MSQTQQERRSILDTNLDAKNWVIKHPDASQLEFKNNAYLKLSNANDHFWELLITKFTETHEEKYTYRQSLAEGIVFYAAGSKPVHIVIEGVLPSGKDIDYRTKFLHKYIMDLRERRLHDDNFLQVHIRHTYFTMQIETFTMSEASDVSDFTSISITGVAHHFNTDDGAKLQYVYEDAQSNNQAISDNGKGNVTYKKVEQKIATDNNLL